MSVWLLGLTLAITALATRITSHTPWIDNSVGIWFQTDDPDLMAYEAHNEAFGEREWTLLMLETDSIFDSGFLQNLSEITTRIEALAHVIKVTSITNVRDNDLNNDNDELNYVTLYPVSDHELASEAEIALLRQRLYRNPIFQNNLLRKESDRHTVLLIQNDNLIHDPSPYRIALVDGIRQIMKDYPLIIDHAIAGTTVVNAALNRASKHDVVVFYSLISILLVLFTFLVFRSQRDLIVLLSVVLGSVLPTMGLIAYLNLSYNMMTVMLPTIMVALGVTGVVHVINTFHRFHQVQGAEPALQKTIAIVLRPGFYATLTTSAGFASLMFSSVIPVQQLGLFAAIGIILAWLLSITIAPVLLHLLWQGKRKKTGKTLSLPWIQQLTRPWSGLSWAIVIIGLALPLSGLLRLETDTNYSEFFAEDAPVSQAYEKIDQAGFAQNPINIGLIYPEEQNYETEAYFKAVLLFEQELSELPQVIKVLSPNAMLSEIDKAFNGPSDQDRLFDYSAEAVSQLLFLGELSGNDDISDLLTKDHTRAQILALTAYMSSKELDQFKADVMALAEQHLPPEMQAYITGTTTLWANMDRHVSRTQEQSLLGMTLFLSFILLFIFRSPRLVLFAMIVNGLPLAIVLGIMGLLDININIATALIGGIILGIVIDDTLHLLMRVHENQIQGKENAISSAVEEVGRSVVHTSLIIVGGFACMMASDFSPSVEFGTFVSLAIVLALVLDLCLLPQLLSFKTLKRLPKLKSRYEAS